MKTSELVAWNCKSFTHGFLGFRPIKNTDIKLKSKKSYMYVTNSSNKYRIPHTNLIQDSPSRLNPKSWKLVIQWYGNASFSHMSWLDLEPYILRIWNYRVIHNINISQHHPNDRIYIIQIWYKTTSRLKPISMKTSDTMAWECKLFT